MRLHTIASTLAGTIPLDQAYRTIIGAALITALLGGLVVLALVLVSRRSR